MSSLFVAVSDLHIGSKKALCTPRFTLDEGGTYSANKAQLWQWPKWLEFWSIVKELKAKYDEFYLVFVGEFRDGIYFADEAITVNEATIFRLVHEVLQPVKELNPDYTFVLRGSRAHSGNASSFDELMADGLKEELNVQSNPSTKQLASWELNLWIEDVLFDIAHHVSMGRLPHTEGPSIAKAAKLLEVNYGRKERLPDIAIRGHQHRMYDTGDMSTIRMITLPGWKFPDAHIMKLNQSSIPHFGGVIFEIDGNLKNVIKYRVSPRRGIAWRKK